MNAARDQLTHADASERRPADPIAAPGWVSTGDASELLLPFAPRIGLVPVVRAAHRRFILRGPLRVTFEFWEGGVHVAHDALYVSGFGADAVEAERDFAESFDTQYRELVEEDESALSPSARRVRHLLLALVESVERV